MVALGPLIDAMNEHRLSMMYGLFGAVDGTKVLLDRWSRYIEASDTRRELLHYSSSWYRSKRWPSLPTNCTMKTWSKSSSYSKAATLYYNPDSPEFHSPDNRTTLKTKATLAQVHAY